MKWKRLIPLALAFSLLAGCGTSGEVPPENSPAPSGHAPVVVSASPAGEPGQPAPTVSPTAPPPIDLSAFALAAPVYPEFPAYPETPADDGDWDAYSDAISGYFQAVSDLRADCDPERVRNNRLIMAFAAVSTPLALQGHEGENAIYSPLSLWSALVLCTQCAQGESRAQLLSALHYGDAEGLTALLREVWTMLYTDDGRDALTLANSVWLNDAAQGHYVQDTLDVLAKDCFSGVYSVPMGTGEADRAITDWTAEQTNGLIGSSGPVVETDELTLAVLASSLYYRAGWENEFLEDFTEEDTFTAANGAESQVDFMHKTVDGLFLKRDGYEVDYPDGSFSVRNGYQAAYLPTRLGEMVFVLPDEGVTPESLLEDPDFLENLTFVDENWEHADPTTAAHWGEVQWSVPKFDVSSNLDLLDTLKKLGVTDLLDPDKSDLSNLTDIPAYLSNALQLARVKVDEEGVEAAAVTILMMDTGAAIPPEDPEVCVMDLDRPFLFVVRSQDLPLFVGVVNQV